MATIDATGPCAIVCDTGCVVLAADDWSTVFPRV